MKHPLKRRIRRDDSGAAVVEFAIMAPLVITLILGAMNLGIYFYSQNALQHALDEAARYATIYPTPSPAAVQARFEDKLVKDLGPSKTYSAVTGGTGNLHYIDFQASAAVEFDLIFQQRGEIPIRAKRRVYLEN